MNTQELALLVKAILTRVRERQGYATKTKVFKYLYLLDLEHFRQTGTLLTGFPWKFHLYGPWCSECEDFYQQLKTIGDVEASPATSVDTEAEFVESTEPVDLDTVMDRFNLPLATRRIIDRWADKRLGDMLDYVYFYTEPMETAQRGQLLDFSTAAKEIHVGSTGLEKRSADKKRAEEILEAIQRNRAMAGEAAAEPHFTPPKYDDVYFDAISRMEEEDE